MKLKEYKFFNVIGYCFDFPFGSTFLFGIGHSISLPEVHNDCHHIDT